MTHSFRILDVNLIRSHIKLVNELFDGYDKRIRPGADLEGSVMNATDVKVNLYLRHISEVSTKNMVRDTKGKIRAKLSREPICDLTNIAICSYEFLLVRT